MLQYSPKIITDSLVMCLDASQNKSYPTDLPVKNGLLVWLDAADDATFSYSSGTSVSQWRDKSGLNNHVGQSTVGSQPNRNVVKNSRKSIYFDGGDSLFNAGDVFPSNTTDYTKIAVVYQTSTSNSGNVISSKTGDSGTNYAHAFYFGSSTAIRLWHSGQFVSSANDLALNTLGIVSGTYINSSGLGSLYVNGTASGTGTAGNRNIVRNIQIGAIIDSSFFIGEICEVLVFSRVLSATELKQVHTYLGQKWGISNTDRSIVDLGGNNIGSFGGAAGSQTVANMPDYDFYNKGALTFNGSSDEVNFGDVIKFTSTQDFTLEVWVNYLPNATSYVPLLSKEDSTGFGYALKVDETYSYQPYLVITGTTSAYRYANVNINDGVWHHIVGVAKASSTTIDMYVDGVLINGIASLLSWAGTATTNALRLGKNYGSAFFKGKLSNSKIYNKALSATEISQNYEAQKSKFANTIVQQGLVLNLDAGNNYSYAGAGAVWYDVSGNSYNGTLIGSPVYTSNNNGGIIFDSVAKYVTLPASGLAFGTGQFAIEAWVFSTAAVSYNHVYSSQSSNNVGFISLYYQNGYGFSVADLGNSAVRTVTTHQTVVSQNTWYHVVGIRNASNQYIVYVNGVESTTNSTSSYPLTATAPQIASNPASNTERFTGTIASFRLYNTSLSAAQVLQNYNATKGRFGL
jgi:hypothetical protein